MAVKISQLTTLGAAIVASTPFVVVQSGTTHKIPLSAIVGGSNTQVQYNNNGVFGGAAGITVVNSGNSFAFGANTPSTGYMRLAPTDAGTYAIVQRDNGNNANITVIGCLSDNVVRVGDATNGPEVHLRAVNNFQVILGASQKMVLTTSSLDIKESNLVGVGAFVERSNLADGSAAHLNIRPAGSTGSNNAGGTLFLRGGRRAGTGNYGTVALQLNQDDSTVFTMLELSHLANLRRILALCRGSALTTTQMPTDTGDLVVYIANAATVPTANPVGGGIIYGEGGALKYRGTSGTVTTLGPA